MGYTELNKFIIQISFMLFFFLKMWLLENLHYTCDSHISVAQLCGRGTERSSAQSEPGVQEERVKDEGDGSEVRLERA